MISAFGVEHVISKGLKPENVAALARVARRQDTPYRHWVHASSKVMLRTEGRDAPKLTNAARKARLAEVSRSDRNTRDANRKAIFKGLKPEHMDALGRVAEKDIFTNFRTINYARNKRSLRNLQYVGDDSGPLEAMRRKTTMSRSIRTKRSLREKNRKPIFGNKES